MHDDLMAAFKPVIDQLQTIVENNPAYRTLLRDLGKALLVLTEETSVTTSAPTADGQSAPPVERPLSAPLAPEAIHGVSKPDLNGASDSTETKLAPSTPAKPVRVVTPSPQPYTQPPVWRPTPVVMDEDLPMIAARCRLKAEGARWAAMRQRLLDAGADYETEIDPHSRDLITRAKLLPDCFLWMCHRDGPTPSDLGQYEDLAGCFDAAAMAIMLLDKLLKKPEDEQEAFEQALDFTAEAQSALRGAIAAMEGYADTDQARIFTWLRTTGATRQILIQRYMRRDDPADPTGWDALQRRIQALDEKLQLVENRSKRRQSLYNKLRYHLKLIQENPGQDRPHDWRKAIETIEELVDNGVPASNRELRDLLLPMIDELPEALELPKNCQLVLREIDRFLSERPAKLEIQNTTSPTGEVQRVAELLRGRTVVLIGGERRSWAADALTQAFGLNELIWIEGHDQSYADFEPQVARPEVAVVILAIRWSRHGFGEVKEFCDRYDKLLVRLPGGYSPNLVAFHMLSQVGERLGKLDLAMP